MDLGLQHQAAAQAISQSLQGLGKIAPQFTRAAYGHDQQSHIRLGYALMQLSDGGIQGQTKSMLAQQELQLLTQWRGLPLCQQRQPRRQAVTRAQ